MRVVRLALVVLGFLAGAAVGVALFSSRLDAVSLEREQLVVKKADLEIQVERLREEVEKARSEYLGGPVVMQVDLNLEGLDDLVGRPVAELDPALVFRLLNGRDVMVEGQRIGVTVKDAPAGGR